MHNRLFNIKFFTTSIYNWEYYNVKAIDYLPLSYIFFNLDLRKSKFNLITFSPNIIRKRPLYIRDINKNYEYYSELYSYISLLQTYSTTQHILSKQKIQKYSLPPFKFHAFSKNTQLIQDLYGLVVITVHRSVNHVPR